MMDHTWDSAYTAQLHKQQYIGLVETNRRSYTIEYTSTPFKNMIYELRAGRGIIKVKVHYWTADGSYEVYANGRLVEMNEFDKEIGAAGEITMYKGCGENRFVGVKNYLEFVMTPYCLIEVKPVDKILSNVRMDWSMDEFWDNGGPTSFVDRVSAALGIHASQMKVVAVYEGSVVVDYEIEADSEDDSGSSSSSAQLSSITTALNNLSVSADAGDIFGAPVLSASTGGEATVEDPTYAAGNAADPIWNEIIIPDAPTAPEVEITIEEDGDNEPSTFTIYAGSTTFTIDEVTRNSLIAVLVVMVLIFGCCFGWGTFVWCVYKFTKESKQVLEARQRIAKMQEAKKNGVNNNSNSEINVDEQYVLPDQIELDMFTKKRESKFNKDAVHEDETEENDSSRASLNSAKKLVNNKKSTPISKEVIVAAKLTSLVRQDNEAK